MSLTQHPQASPVRVEVGLFLVLVATLLVSCSPQRSGPMLPPSDSDLPLVQAGEICTQKSLFMQAHKDFPQSGDPWGTGEEVRVPTYRSGTRADESFFFDQDGLLVGYFIVFEGDGLPLEPYSVLRDTLGQLRPTVQFYLDLSGIQAQERTETATLYRTGDVKSTTQYLVAGTGSDTRLLSASVAIDPYFQLLSPYRQEMVRRLPSSRGKREGARAPIAGITDEESFASLQQFARGETALLAYCTTRDERVAADAYEQAIRSGFSNKRMLAEAHHKLGLSLKSVGKLDRAGDEMRTSLKIMPNRPDVLNNLGEIYEELGDRRQALAAFEQAVTLKPNYAIARFNLAEAYEQINRKRSIEEYETYLALAEGVPGEGERTARAHQRLKALRR